MVSSEELYFNMVGDTGVFDKQWFERVRYVLKEVLLHVDLDRIDCFYLLISL